MSIQLTIFLSLILVTGLSIFFNSKFAGSIKDFVLGGKISEEKELSFAISAHWMFAIAIFFGTSMAYKFGIFGMFWFIVPNVLSLIWMGIIANNIKNNYGLNFSSLVEFISTKVSKRVGFLFLLELLILAVSALNLAFIAISKGWTFVGLDNVTGINSTNIILIVTLLSLAQAIFGGIRTSIFSGTIQGVAWLVVSIIIFMLLINPNITFGEGNIGGVKNIDNLFDSEMLFSFAIFTAISLTVGATSHGALWQKKYTSKSGNDLKKIFTYAAINFGIIITAISILSILHLNNQSENLENIQQSVLLGAELLGGKALLTAIICLIFLHSSSLIDAYSNYFSSLISFDLPKIFPNLKKQFTNLINIKIFTVISIILCFCLFLAKLSIWYIFGLMSILRIVNFFPLIFISLKKNISENYYFYICSFFAVLCFAMFFIAKSTKNNELLVLAGALAFFGPLAVLSIIKK